MLDNKDRSHYLSVSIYFSHTFALVGIVSPAASILIFGFRRVGMYVVSQLAYLDVAGE